MTNGSVDIARMVKIEKIEGEDYLLIFRPSDAGSSLDGNAWSLLVHAYCNAINAPIGDVVHDPESDMYAAISADRKQLEAISKAIEVLSRDPALRDTLLSEIDHVDEIDDDLTTEEFLAWMADAGFDMTAPQTFNFGFDSFRNLEQVKNVQAEIERHGYMAEVEVTEDDIFFEVNVDTMPALSALQEIENYLESIALKYDIKYIGFGVDFENEVNFT